MKSDDAQKSYVSAESEARVSSEKERKEWMAEHLLYERQMLDAALAFMNEVPRNTLLWNAVFESFCIHARNIYDFLTNGGEANNFKALDFVSRFKAGSTASISQTVNRLHPATFHMGKSRPTKPEEKFSSDHAKRVYDWLDENFRKFERELGEPYAVLWKAIHTAPSIAAPAGTPTATNNPTFVKSGD